VAAPADDLSDLATSTLSSCTKIKKNIT